jgi:hypothetical protein
MTHARGVGSGIKVSVQEKRENPSTCEEEAGRGWVLRHEISLKGRNQG